MSLWSEISDRIIDLLVTEWEFTDQFVQRDTLPTGIPKRTAQYKRGLNIDRGGYLVLAQNIQHALIIQPGAFSQRLQGNQRRFAQTHSIMLQNFVLFKGNYGATMEELQETIEYVTRFLNQFPILSLERHIYNTLSPNSEGIGDVVDNEALVSLEANGLVSTLETHANNTPYMLPTLPSMGENLRLIRADLIGGSVPNIWQGESKEYYMQDITMNVQYNYSSRVVSEQ